jgi:PRC-barrel domain
VNVVRLERHQHPSPPRHELRNRGVYASTGQYLGHVDQLYVDDDRKLRFVDVVTGGFLGLGRKHHLIPVEAITEEALNAITLGVDEETVEGAPTIPNPLVGPDENHQRTLYEHYGYPSPG